MLREHGIILREQDIVLRPLTENDWTVLMRWANDPEVLYFSEGDEVSGRDLEEHQAILRHVSQTAYCFIIERAGEPIGDCWLQRLNLQRLIARFPDKDCRRIDLELARAQWGQGVGSATIKLLTEFAWEDGAQAVLACDVADYNSRSRAAFERAGFAVIGVNGQPAGGKARQTYDLALFPDVKRGEV